jgi:hypothetical protein
MDQTDRTAADDGQQTFFDGETTTPQPATPGADLPGGTNPPTDEMFGAAHHLRDEVLESLGAYIVAKHADRLGHLTTLPVEYFWAKRGGRRGYGSFGTCRLVQRQNRVYTEARFRVDVAANAVRNAELSMADLERALFRLLVATGSTEAGDPLVRRPDVSLFLAEVEEYGAWNGELQMAAASLRDAAER